MTFMLGVRPTVYNEYLLSSADFCLAELLLTRYLSYVGVQTGSNEILSGMRLLCHVLIAGMIQL